MNALTVVLVDNAMEIRHRVKALLEDIPNVEVVGEVGDAVNAMEIIETLRPQVVILDIPLPSGNGTGVLRHIKLLDPSIVVIMLTNLVVPYYHSCVSKVAPISFLTNLVTFRNWKVSSPSYANPVLVGTGFPAMKAAWS